MAQDKYVRRHAIRNVWCAPGQDNQFIFKLDRLTPFNGVVGSFRNLWDVVPLPEAGVWFHLFQIGQVHPSLINLTEIRDTWTKLSVVCNDKKFLLDVYNTAGIKLPSTEVYFIFTKNNNILLAFKNLNIPGFDYNHDDVYFRTYKNSFFESPRSNHLTDGIVIDGGLINSNEAILAYQGTILDRRLQPGHVYCFVNGVKQDDINLITTKINDYVEYIHDTSIKLVVDFKINNLPQFDSVRDGKGKYVLHYNGSSNVIDWNDDIDIFVISASTGKGFYVHKNHRDTLRNITHKDYTLVTSYIQSTMERFRVNGALNTDDLRVRLHIRKAGFARSLILEKNRINELYKLPNNRILEAFVGINSNVSVWRADALENSRYIKLMGAKEVELTKQNCVETYGFSSIAKLVADTPTDTYDDAGVIKADVPYLLTGGCTAFEYDANGILLGWLPHASGDVHICGNEDTVYVEFIAGIGDDELDESYTFTNNTLTEYVNYRFYTCGLNGSVYDNEWEDVTGTDAYSVASNGAVTWDLVNKLPMIRSDKKFFCKDYTIDFTRGRLEVPINYLRTILSTTITDLIKVALGELTVFLNGKSLIEDLDYYFDSSTGKIIIVNKSYLIGTGAQEVTIRFTGFCDSDLKHNKQGEFGFIQRGRVSDNHRFDIKDGKVQRIVVNGSLRVPTQISYYDDLGSGTVFNGDNGKPYFIKDLVVPMMNMAEKETYTFKKESDLIDKEISDYMTLYMNQNSTPDLSVITTKHYLYSPFLATILDDLISGVINSAAMTERFTNEFVSSVCKPYETLLPFDPINTDNAQSRDYVIVHAHRYSNVVALDLPRFRFFSKVISIYGNGNIEAVNQIRIA